MSPLTLGIRKDSLQSQNLPSCHYKGGKRSLCGFPKINEGLVMS